MRTQLDEIVSYWESRVDECELSIDWAEAKERCWRCGDMSRLERAHIVPHSLGGPDTPSNYVLLCQRCHREAPNVADQEFMWAWLRAHATSFYDSYWTLRGAREFETIYHRKPFSDLPETAGLKEEELKTLLKPLFQKVSWHFGEGRLNPSTIAWCIREIECELTKQKKPIQAAEPMAPSGRGSS